MAPSWAGDFSVFYAAMGQPPVPGMELDRIDPNGNYEPGNCRWATRREQVSNTNRTVWVTFGGERKILKDFAAEQGVSYSTMVHRRIDRGLGGSRDVVGELLL